MEQDKNHSMEKEEEFEPKTQEKGELVPPVRRPPTAVGTGTPPPPPPRPRPSGPAPVPHGRPMLWYVLQAVRRSLAAVVDLADAAGDVIGRGLAGRT
jgi:hypothetical protein